MTRNALHAARDLVDRGFAVIPVPPLSKKPSLNGWQLLRLNTHEQLNDYFTDPESNVGVLLGEPSNWIVDVDLDHPLAVELAAKHLPPTDCMFGRPGKPRSHWLYRLNAPGSTRRFTLSPPSRAMIVELRSTGCQTVAPGSLHPTGEAIDWHSDGHPADIAPADLIAACAILAEAVRERCGEKQVVRDPHQPENKKPGKSTLGAHLAHTSETPYALAALKYECDEVARAAEGGRNNRLSTAAFKLGTLIGAGELDRSRAAQGLSDAARACGLPDSEARATIRSGIDAGGKLPRQRDREPVSDPYKLASRKQVSMSQAISDTSSSNRKVPPDGSEPPEGWEDVREPQDKDLIEELGELREAEPNLLPPVVDRILREGEVMNIISVSKAGKSWLAHDLALCVATGSQWLGMPTVAGKTLIIDGELKRPTLSYRLGKAQERFPRHDVRKTVHTMALRGKNFDIDRIARMVIDTIEQGTYRLVIIDPLYKFMPAGHDENSNADMTKIYNTVDSIAEHHGCAVVIIHHAAKGNQADRSVNDVGAGAGAQSRAADTHFVLRPHEEDGVVVGEASIRSFKPMEPFCVRWNEKTFAWEPDDQADPTLLKRPGRKTKPKSEQEEYKPPKRQWDAASFANEMIGKTPVVVPEVFLRAADVGLSKAKAQDLIKIGLENRLIFQHFNPNRSYKLSTIDPELLG